ncbi:DUF305 domain-containing protein [Altererythrobacter sp. H2]|uniref:DUF305 domain-containing protein n=1 Tax=Altererythrobacter sp. H2 TaxID=3108391 RepID=UPI000BD7ED1F|nr:DUF305 domain-containing protein [Altererythrobacter sp. H2]OZA93882.1 MAG: DUF305 domain-containing protein [Erythrobacter sp. 34-65-8]WRK96361.1 DUF305 domain-containing protein [Altererythrobacter sp. H2]
MDQSDNHMAMGWGRFAAMIVTSTVIMFVLMYQLVYSGEHALFSVNRLLASLIMGGVMTAVMLAFMWKMYQPKGAKIAVLSGGLLVAGVLLVLNRSQTLIDDTRFMESMIPHHSIAINNARKAEISDPRVRELADEIIRSQVREIAEMKLLLDEIDQNGEQGNAPLPAVPAEVTPDMVPQIRAAKD